MKNNKALGSDNIYSETFLLINKQYLETVVTLLSNIYAWIFP